MFPGSLVVGVAAAIVLAGCGDVAEGEASSEAPASTEAAETPTSLSPTCTLAAASSPLPEELRETSGLAQSRRDPTLFWTHNDNGNDPVLFGIGPDGAIRQRVGLAGAEPEDWEDIEAGPCASGTCLFLADIGDNEAERENVVVYRIPEPAANATNAARPAALRARYPDGAQDAEALIVSATGEIYIVGKGRDGPVRLYKFPAQESSGVATLTLVKELIPEPRRNVDRITAGTLSVDGRWVGVRSYANLYIYEASTFFASGPSEKRTIDLGPTGHDGGESLVIGNSGTVWVTSEAGGRRSPPEWARLECSLGG